jgi:hypothetical protein
MPLASGKRFGMTLSNPNCESRYPTLRFRGLPLCGGNRGNGLSRCKMGYLSGNLAQHYNLGELRVCSSARS